MSESHLINTRRLTLRPVNRDDQEALHKHFNDADVLRFIWDVGEVTPEKVTELIETSIKQFREIDCGLWVVSPSGTHDFAGCCGFCYFWEPPVLELLYGLEPDYRGRGVASELAETMIVYASDTLGHSVVRASVAADNAPSIRVLEKQGMVYAHRATENDVEYMFYEFRRVSR